jgi:predicted Zn-dependent protease with MMP-like domain
MIDIPPERFSQMVQDALDSVPEDLAAKMDNVAVFVEETGPRPTILGLYQGYPLTRRSRGYGMGTASGRAYLPDRIFIYRQPILSHCHTEEEVARRVRVVVIHEIAHHFGIGEARLRELGWV